MVALDKTGQRFGRLVVIDRVSKPGEAVKWQCRCDCGGSAIVKSYLLGRHTNSCGCVRRETSRAKRTHGLSSDMVIYHAWWNARDRCHNPACDGYARYGGRGISMCHEWRVSIEAFHRDMGPRPSPQHTLERVNNDGDYCKENCVWARQSTQNRNRKGNHRVTYRGQTLPLVDWAARLNIHPGTLRARVLKWPIERAFNEPVRACGR